jgi:hypothetical protein
VSDAHYHNIMPSLMQDIERETIEFEAHVLGNPFLPPEENQYNARKLEQHCHSISVIIANLFKTPGVRYYHFGEMRKNDARQADLRVFNTNSHGVTLSRTSRISGNPPGRLYLKAGLTHGLGPLPGMLGTTPVVIPPTPGVVVAYIIFENQKIAEILRQGVDPVDLYDELERRGVQWRTDFVFCEPYRFGVDHESRQRVLRDVELAIGDRKPIFESYHMVFELPHVPDDEMWWALKMAIRMKEMRFQRDWGDQTRHELAAEHAKVKGLITLNHEFKNTLGESGWELLYDTLGRNGARAYETPEFQQRVVTMLGNMIWLRGLCHAIRALSRGKEDLLDDWLSTPVSDASNFRVLYQDSIQHLVDVVMTYNCDSGRGRLRVAYLTEDDDLQDCELRERQTIHHGGVVLDLERLKFPPLRSKGRDGHAPIVTLASFIMEPCRNAVSYVTQNHDRLFPRAFIAIRIARDHDGVAVQIANPVLQPSDGLECHSMRILTSLAAELCLARLEPPRTLKTSKGLILVNTVVLTPHLLNQRNV